MLKKARIIFFTFLLVKSAFPQKYQPFDSTTVWSSEYSYKHAYNCYVQQNTKTYITGFVTDLGRIWHKVYYTTISQIHPFSVCSSGPPPTIPPPQYNVFAGYLFNDTTNKKVYLLGSAPSNYTLSSGNVLYDFNKATGDTFYINPQSYTPPYYKFKINSIDSIFFSGKYHKRFLVSCTPSALSVPNPSSFVEGVGSAMGPLWQVINGMGEQFTNLICFASPAHTLAVNSHTAFTSSSFCSNLVLDVKNENRKAFSLYPNPVTDFLIIENATRETKYQIYNSIGQMQSEGEIKESAAIDIRNRANGIYYLKLSDPDQNATLKIVVQRE